MHFGSLVSTMRALNQGFQMQNRVVGAIVISPTDALRQEAVLGSAQRGTRVGST